MGRMRNSVSFAQAYPDYVNQWHPANTSKPESTARSSNVKVLWQCPDIPSHTWMSSPNSRFKPSGKHRGCPQCAGNQVNHGVNDLETRYPDVARQWSGRNIKSPSEVHAMSNKKAWWIGDCGHEWNMMVISRTAQMQGCPFCSGRRVFVGDNDLATKCPELKSEWDDERDITEFTHGSAYTAQWRCCNGHSWKAKIVSRTRGRGCPFCSGRKVLVGFNDLATVRPDLAAMWCPTNSKRSTEITAGSKYRASWKCAEGHVTRSTVCDRAYAKGQCPVCSGTTRMRGVNDFATKYPDIAKEWVGGDKQPFEVLPRSSVVAEWKCSNGHPLWTAPFSRRANGHGCPFCAGQRAITGVNDLASQFPDIAAEWHEDNDVPPSLVAKSSSTIYKWKCGESHEWSVSPNQRTSHREGVTGCPECFSKGRSSMENDMADMIKRNYSGKVIVRHKIGRMELDVYLPSEKLAFEFNGVHWHSELRGRTQMSHFNKVSVCRDKGIALIQIWEDDWRDRHDVVERLILRKIGVDNAPCVDAHIASVVELKASVVRRFMNENHIQGFTGGTHYDALISHGGDVVAVMVTTHLKKFVRLERYATAANVQGGFSRLLNVVRARAAGRGYTSIISFSDNEMSDGNLYSVNGFHYAGDIAPDYKYVHKATRHHKSLFRKNRFRRDTALKYDPSMTESELAVLNKLSRVWDSGKIKWELSI